MYATLQDALTARRATLLQSLQAVFVDASVVRPAYFSRRDSQHAAATIKRLVRKVKQLGR